VGLVALTACLQNVQELIREVKHCEIHVRGQKSTRFTGVSTIKNLKQWRTEKSRELAGKY